MKSCQRGKRDKRAGCSKCKETGRSRSLQARKEEGEVLKKQASEKTEQETRSIKSTGSGKEEEAVSAVIKALL